VIPRQARLELGAPGLEQGHRQANHQQVDLGVLHHSQRTAHQRKVGIGQDVVVIEVDGLVDGLGQRGLRPDLIPHASHWDDHGVAAGIAVDAQIALRRDWRDGRKRLECRPVARSLIGELAVAVADIDRRNHGTGSHLNLTSKGA
jgi:hypothetical protein